MHIPKLFHRIWLGDRPLPSEFREYETSWRRLHPGWEFVTWTDENLPEIKNAQAFASARSPADAANILRYELVYAYGGVYVDTDFFCQKAIDSLISDDMCFVARQLDGVVNNAIIGAVPGHAFCQDLVSSLDNHIAAIPVDSRSVLRSGPFYLSSVLLRHPEVTVYPALLFYPYEWHERWRRDEGFPEAFAIHHWTLSGRVADRPVRTPIGDHAQPCLTIVIIVEAGDSCGVLEWVLEGLCSQTVENIEVLVTGAISTEMENVIAQQFLGRLPIVRYDRERAADEIKQRSGAVLLRANCIPEAGMVRMAVASLHVQPITTWRIWSYPRHKYYQFPRGMPVDYQGLRRHVAPLGHGLDSQSALAATVNMQNDTAKRVAYRIIMGDYSVLNERSYLEYGTVDGYSTSAGVIAMM